MIDLSKVHEKEVLDLVSPIALSLKSVAPVLNSLGFSFQDDFAELMRSDSLPPWQSESLASCTFFANGNPIDPSECDFDLIRYSILVATLPAAQVSAAIQQLHTIAERLSLSVTYAGSPVSPERCAALANNWRADILAETGDVGGSDSVRLLIAMEYEKKRR